MDKHIRAIQIDTINHAVREIFLDGTLDCLNKFIGCEYLCTASCDIPRGNVLYVDDEGLFDKRKGAFRIPCRPGTQSVDGEPYQTISGNGVIVGVDQEGYDVDTSLTVEQLRGKVKFVSTEDLPEVSVKLEAFDLKKLRDMATRIVIFDTTTYERIHEIIEYAELHPYTMDDMLDVMNGQKELPGDNPNHVINLSFGVRVVYSHEMQNPGLCKHISISVDADGKLPSPGLVQEIMKAFKIESDLQDCSIAFEKFGDKNEAISVIETPKKPSK